MLFRIVAAELHFGSGHFALSAYFQLSCPEYLTLVFVNDYRWLSVDGWDAVVSLLEDSERLLGFIAITYREKARLYTEYAVWTS
jgi:hypothetical protein